MFLFVLFYILVALPILIILPTRVFGRKNLIKGKSIIICNHTSNFDGPMLDFYLRRRIRFLAKKELFTTKTKKWFMTSVLGSVAVDRKQADLTATKNILKLLKEDKSVGIFPQGTRSSNDDMQIKNGVCLFAIKAKAPIIPVYILSKPKLFKRNKILIGKPYELSEYYDQKLTKEVMDEAGDKVLASIEQLKVCYDKYEQEKALNKEYKKLKKRK